MFNRLKKWFSSDCKSASELISELVNIEVEKDVIASRRDIKNLQFNLDILSETIQKNHKAFEEYDKTVDQKLKEFFNEQYCVFQNNIKTIEHSLESLLKTIHDKSTQVELTQQSADYIDEVIQERFNKITTEYIANVDDVKSDYLKRYLESRMKNNAFSIDLLLKRTDALQAKISENEYKLLELTDDSTNSISEDEETD